MTAVKLTIEGEPCAWKRAGQVAVMRNGQPVLDQRGRPVVRKYVDPKEADFRTRLQWEYRAASHGVFFEGAIELHVLAVTSLPKSAPKRLRERVAAGELVPCTKMAKDWDNIGKLIGDALQGIAFPNDKQITDGHVRKRYGARAFTEIVLRAVDDG